MSTITESKRAERGQRQFHLRCSSRTIEQLAELCADAGPGTTASEVIATLVERQHRLVVSGRDRNDAKKA